VPLVVLKGMALHLTRRTPIDSRAASDVDLLVADRSLPALAEALEREGFRPDAGGPACEHQLPALHRASGECVDLHRFLPGVRLPGERGFAGASSLARQGLLDPVAELGVECFVPAPAVLAAHALVHGVAQHGFAPGSYPGTRMLADLLDLGWGDGEASSRYDEAVGLTSHVRSEEARAVWALCAALRAGESLPAILRSDGSPAHVLLAHILAGAEDPAYREALKLRALGSSPSRLPRSLAWIRDAARAMAPTRAQIEALHGGRSSLLRTSARRLARPFDLARRAFGAARRAGQVRRPRARWARMKG
jgi:putative nucleotidyltransferase-like protein